MRAFLTWLLAISLAASVAASSAGAAELVDATGRTVVVPDRITRVMPVGPPAAVLLAIMAPDLMVGWPNPPDAAATAFLTEEATRLPRTPMLGDRAHLDGAVLAADIAAAHPDLILDYGSTGSRYADLIERAQAASGVPSVLIDGRLSFTPLALRVLGRLLHREQRAEGLARLAEGILASAERQPTETSVVYVHGAEGGEIAVPGGNNSELLEFPGWRLMAPAGDVGGRAFRPASIAEIAALDPDILLFSSPAMRERVAASPEWRALRAVRDRHAWIVPSEPFGWIEGPPSVNRLLGLAWLGGGMPSAGAVATAAMFHASFYGRTPTPGQVDAIRAALQPIQP